MSEKRFELSEIYSNTIMDTENCINNGSHCRIYDIEEVVDLLNEQQALIEKQNKLIEKLRWDLNKTREDLNYFANLKLMAMKGCEPNE